MEDTRVMLKCEFCEYSSPKGSCDWTSKAIRQSYCEKAIAKLQEFYRKETPPYYRNTTCTEFPSHINTTNYQNHEDYWNG